MAKYSHHSGASLEDAIVISGVANHSAGVQAEYDYIIQKHGQPRVGWTMSRQALLQENGRSYDYLEIVLRDGSPKTYYFDISAFFGQLEAEMMPKQTNIIKHIFGAIRRLFGG